MISAPSCHAAIDEQSRGTSDVPTLAPPKGGDNWWQNMNYIECHLSAGLVSNLYGRTAQVRQTVQQTQGYKVSFDNLIIVIDHLESKHDNQKRGGFI